jgi:16S rRNA G966 N2-methylase RsmD
LGFEAASRGAAEVLLLERDAQLAKSLEASRVRLKAEPAQLRIECADAIGWMGRCAPARFELVLLDPPFDAGLFEPALRAAAPLLVSGGLLYVESPEPISPPAELGLEALKSGRAGAVHYQLFRRGG